MTAAQLQARLNKEHLSLFGFSILGQTREKPRTVSHLARSVKTSLQNCSAVVGRMEERGVLERKADPEDRRLTFVHITGMGLELLGRIEAQ